MTYLAIFGHLDIDIDIDIDVRDHVISCYIVLTFVLYCIVFHYITLH